MRTATFGPRIRQGPAWGARSPDFVNPLRLPQNESEFRDKLSPIHIALNFSLDPQAPVDSHGLRPVLHYQSKSRIEDKVRPGRGSQEERGPAGGACLQPGEALSPLSAGLPRPRLRSSWTVEKTTSVCQTCSWKCLGERRRASGGGSRCHGLEGGHRTLEGPASRDLLAGCATLGSL